MDTTDILIKIRKIVRSINLESKKIQKDYGISIPQVLCLGFLQNAPNYQSTQREIKDFLNLNASTVSGIINRLENKGLIARLPKNGDKRVVNIVLTASGYQLMEHIPPLLHDQLSDKLKALDDSELKNVEGSLDTLIGILNIQKIEASPILTNEATLEENQTDI